jgi:hypothetical protein
MELLEWIAAHWRTGNTVGTAHSLSVEVPPKRRKMRQKLRIVLIGLLVLIWAFAGVQGMTIALERKDGLFRRPDTEGQSLANLAVADLVERTGLVDEAVHVQSIERTEFPDASLGAPEPGVNYPRETTQGYNIRLQVGDVVYRYWAAGGHTVYVESYLALPQEGEDSN